MRGLLLCLPVFMLSCFELGDFVKCDSPDDCDRSETCEPNTGECVTRSGLPGEEGEGEGEGEGGEGEGEGGEGEGEEEFECTSHLHEIGGHFFGKAVHGRDSVEFELTITLLEGGREARMSLRVGETETDAQDTVEIDEDGLWTVTFQRGIAGQNTVVLHGNSYAPHGLCGVATIGIVATPEGSFGAIREGENSEDELPSSCNDICSLITP